MSSRTYAKVMTTLIISNEKAQISVSLHSVFETQFVEMNDDIYKLKILCLE